MLSLTKIVSKGPASNRVAAPRMNSPCAASAKVLTAPRALHAFAAAAIVPPDTIISSTIKTDLSLKSPTISPLVMIPLLLAAAMTAAAMVALSIPLKVANVIVLPLLLGMGVDNGLHVVGRFRETGSIADVYKSSTPRAVLVSVLTTLMSFVALAFAAHRGMASMGQLLAIAIGFILFATLIVLPALLAWRVQNQVKS